MPKSRTDAEFIAHFWEQVDKPDIGCWEWQGTLNNGYGIMVHKQKRYKTHRLAWELTYGPIPDGALVCHHCDNPKCVRPDHLFIGTIGDNNRDMSLKGRHWKTNMRGEAHPNSKLNDETVKLIRQLYQRGSREFGSCGLARRFGVTHSIIKLVVSHRSWTHIP